MRASQFHLIVRRCQAARDSAALCTQALLQSTRPGFINRRLKENLTLPEQLGDCENLSSVLRVYGAYCRTVAAQYQAVFAHLQLIGLNLASEVSATALVPMRIFATQHRHIARSPDRAARRCFPKAGPRMVPPGASWKRPAPPGG
jgi:hypothetical protein